MIMRNELPQYPIRVLCVFATLNRGGAESMCMNLYRHIDRTKVQFDFVKHTPEKGAFEDEIISLGGRIFEAPKYQIYNHFMYCAWWDKHFRNHPEHQIIHGHYFTIASIYFKIAHKVGLKTIAHSHSVSNGQGVGACAKKMFQRSLEKYSDYCFACGQNAGKWLFPHKKFYVLPNAIDCDSFAFDPVVRSEVRTELGVENTFVLGTVGNIAQPKNPSGLLHIFLEVKKLRPDAKLLWVGRDAGAEGAAVKEEAAGCGADKDIIFTGQRSDVPRLLQAMDVFLLPSLWEGMPVVGIEAQAAGLPCFISDRVTREVDAAGRCVFLPLGDPALWAERILAADTARADTKQKIMDSGYDIHVTADRLLKFYLSL